MNKEGKQAELEEEEEERDKNQDDLASSLGRDSLTGQYSQSTVSTSLNLLREPISLRDSRFAKDLEAISLSGGLGYLERLRDENLGLGLGMAFSCSSKQQDITQSTDSAINQESKIRDQKTLADQTLEDSLDEDKNQGKIDKNQSENYNASKLQKKVRRIQEIHDNDALKLNQTIVSFERDRVQSHLQNIQGGNQDQSYNILSDELIEERFKKIDANQLKAQNLNYGDFFRNGQGFADEYELIQEQVKLRKRDYLSKFKQRNLIIKKNKNDLKFKDLDRMSREGDLNFDDDNTSEEEESKSIQSERSEDSLTRKKGFNTRGYNQRELKVLNKHNLKTQKARDDQEEGDLSSMLIDQRNSRGQRLRNDELKIGEDQIYFHDINNNTPLDYYDIFNRNMSILSNANLTTSQIEQNEERTFINRSGHKKTNQNIFQTDNISEGEEPNNFAQHHDFSFEKEIKYSLDGEEIKEQANVTTHRFGERGMIQDELNRFNDAYSEQDEGAENLHILDKIVADFNNSSSRFLFDSENMRRGPKPKTVPFKSQKMSQSFLESNLFYPDLFENYMPTYEEMADRRLINQCKKQIDKYVHEKYSSYYEQLIKQNCQNQMQQNDSDTSDGKNLENEYAFQLGYAKGQEVADEMMRKVEQDEAEMQQIINQIKYQETPFFDLIEDVEENANYVSQNENNTLEDQRKVELLDEQHNSIVEGENYDEESSEIKNIDGDSFKPQTQEQKGRQNAQSQLKNSKDFQFSGINFKAIDDILSQVELEVTYNQSQEIKPYSNLAVDYSAVAEQLNLIETDGWNNETLLKILGIGESVPGDSEADQELKLMLEQEEQQRLKEMNDQSLKQCFETIGDLQVENQEVEEEIKFYLNSEDKYERAVQAFKELIDQQKAMLRQDQEQLQRISSQVPRVHSPISFIEEANRSYEDKEPMNQETMQLTSIVTQDLMREQPLIEHNLKRLQNFIKGDLFHCAICSSPYEAESNLPRVLFCGDCLCEGCIKDAILPIGEQQQQQQQQQQTKEEQKVPVKDAQPEVSSSQSILGKMLKCWICDAVHHFKLTAEGYIICNDNYIKVRDEHGLINVSPDLSQQLKDYEIEEIPNDLILRSIPVNVELMESMREKETQGRSHNLLQYISQYVQIDKLSKRQAKYYLHELCNIVDYKDTDFTLSLEGEEVNASNLSSNVYDPNGDARMEEDEAIRNLRCHEDDSLERPAEQLQSSLLTDKQRGELVEQILAKTLLSQGYSPDDIDKMRDELLQSKDKLMGLIDYLPEQADLLNKDIVPPIAVKKSAQKQLEKQMQNSSTLAHLNNQTASKLQQTAQRLANQNQLQQQQSLFKSNASAPVPANKNKIDPFEDFNASNHFGPGNNAYAKIFEDFKAKDKDLEDEEGLDEREPEKAICPEGVSLHNGSQSSSQIPSQKIPQRSHNSSQLQEGSSSATQMNGDSNSANKKNLRKKKKRQKARQQKQEQKSKYKNGFQMDDATETDLYSMLVPPEEFQGSHSKNAGDIQKQQLRNPFCEYLPNENFYQLKSLQDQYPGLKDNQLNFSLLCEQCSSDFVLAPDALSMNYMSSQQIQIPKLQSQMKKELLESGILTIISHQCQDCVSQNQTGASPSQPTMLSMCLFCALLHKQKHPQHNLKQVVQKQTLQSLNKRSSVFEQLLNSAVNERVRYQVDNEISKLLASMRAIFKLPVSLLQVQNQPNQIPQIFQKQAQTNSQLVHQATH